MNSSTTIADALENISCPANLTSCNQAMTALEAIVDFCTKSAAISVAPWCNAEIGQTSFYKQIENCRFLVADGCLSSENCEQLTNLCESFKRLMLNTPEQWKNWCNLSRSFIVFDAILCVPLLASSINDLCVGNNEKYKEPYIDHSLAVYYVSRTSCQVLNCYIRHNSVIQWKGTPYAEAEHLSINCLRNAMFFYGMGSIIYLASGFFSPKHLSSLLLLSTLFVLGGAATELLNVDFLNF